MKIFENDPGFCLLILTVLAILFIIGQQALIITAGQDEEFKKRAKQNKRHLRRARATRILVFVLIAASIAAILAESDGRWVAGEYSSFWKQRHTFLVLITLGFLAAVLGDYIDKKVDQAGMETPEAAAAG